MAYYPLEVYVLPWTSYSDITDYLANFYTIPQPTCVSSVVFAIFRWYYTTAAIVWIVILLNSLVKNLVFSETESYLYAKDLIISKNYKVYNKCFIENIILNSMLACLVICITICCWYECVYHHMM